MLTRKGELKYGRCFMENLETTEAYGTSPVFQPVEIKYGRGWWQFWKPWKVKVMTPAEMQREINKRMAECLNQL
jgi:hypothetical protein